MRFSPGRRTPAVLLWTAVLLTGCAGRRLAPVDSYLPGLFDDPARSRPLVDSADGYARAEAGFEALAAGDLQAARKLFERLLKDPPEGVSPSALEPAHTGLGGVWLAAGETEVSEGEFQRALGLRADSVGARTGQVAVLHAGGDDEGAWRMLESMGVGTASGPSGAGVRLLAARVRARLLAQWLEQAEVSARSGEPARAAALLRRAAALEPQNQMVAQRSASASLAAGDAAAAETAFEALVAADPADVTAWLGLGEARLQLAQLDGARQAIERASRLPGGMEQAQALARRLREAGRSAAGQSSVLNRALQSAVIDRAGLATLLVSRLPLLERLGRSKTPIVLSDVSGSPARAAIQEMVALGVLSAYENHRFRPESAVSRGDLAEAAAAVIGLLRASGRISERRPSLMAIADVPPEHLNHEAVAVALRYGVIELSGGAEFKPGRPVSGAEAALAVDRLAKLAR